MKLLESCELPVLGSLKNRVVMSAMTRNFSPDHHCSADMAAYYGRRAQQGVALILTEGVIVYPSGDGYNQVPHLCQPSHAASWKAAVEQVHAAGSKIFCQLWHCGRISHSDYTGGLPPVSSTARPAAGINRQNNKPFGMPRALRTEEIAHICRQFQYSAQLAIEAGFDGVELHMGHGYLLDQFFDANINDRTDVYGGSVQNRCRFALELVQLILEALGSGRVMVRISPSRDLNGIYDWPDLTQMLDELIPGLDRLGLRLLDVSCARSDYHQTSGRVIRMLRPRWPHVLLGGASLSPEQAEQALSSGQLDLVTWGRFILANPDFVEKICRGEALTAFVPELLKALT